MRCESVHFADIEGPLETDQVLSRGIGRIPLSELMSLVGVPAGIVRYPSIPGAVTILVLLAGFDFPCGMPCWWQPVHLTQWMLWALAGLA